MLLVLAASAYVGAVTSYAALEALRGGHYFAPGGGLVVNDPLPDCLGVPPAAVLRHLADYPLGYRVTALSASLGAAGAVAAALRLRPPLRPST